MVWIFGGFLVIVDWMILVCCCVKKCVYVVFIEFFEKVLNDYI